MTIHRRLNQPGMGGHYPTWFLIRTMLDAGWTIPMSGSGDGGLYATSNVFDPAQAPKNSSSRDPNGVGVGLEPWAHPNCWAVLQDPSGNRQYLIQRYGTDGDTYDGYWRFFYSPGGLYGVGQTPGVDWLENVRPAASDQASLDDLSTIWCNGTTATLTHVAADDAPSPAGEYGVICLAFQPSNSLAAAFVCDDVRHGAATEPHALTNWVMQANDRLTRAYYHGTTGQQSPGGMRHYSTPIQAYETNLWHGRWYGYTGECLPGNGGTGVDGKERAAPIVVGFKNSIGFIGVSRWFYDPSVIRSYPDTGASLQYLFVNDLLVADLWDGVTAPATV